jgi:hypothetical protein
MHNRKIYLLIINNINDIKPMIIYFIGTKINILQSIKYYRICIPTNETKIIKNENIYLISTG